MAKKPVGISSKQEKAPLVITSAEPLDAASFIMGCNERGSTALRYQATADECNPVPSFTTAGLAHLAGLLSDQNTASGGVQRQPSVPEEPKRWAMGFLSQFNPKGYCKINRPDFLYDFAKQVVDGEPYYEPTIKL